ncbi:MAG: ABC transporter substrate-binding protein [Acidimicrobiales bacterium]
MRRPTTRLLVALLAAFALVAAACGDDDDTETGGDGGSGGGEAPVCTEDSQSGPAISIGAQDFGESAILAEIYQQALDCAGFEADIQTLGGFRDLLFGSFDSGDINLAPDYVASNLEFLNDFAGEATGDVDETLGKLTPLLEDEGLVALEPSAAVDTNSFVVTQETSEDLGITTLSELAEKGQDLTLGAPQDCETNGFCIPGLQRVYDLDLSENFVGLDFGVIPASLDEGAIDVGVVGSTDGRLADPATGWVLLEDDQGMLAADNVFPLASQELADAYGDDLSRVLDGISAELTTEDLTELNKRFDVDKEDADAIAESWLADHGIGGA